MIESFGDHMLAFFPTSCFTGFVQIDAVIHLSLGNLVRPDLNTFDSEEAL